MLTLLAVLAQRPQPRPEEVGAGGAFGGMFCCFVYAVLIVVIFASLWKIFEKAGQPGWAGIIPIYNTFVLVQIVGKPVWWFIMLLIPCVNIVFSIMLAIELAKVFNKGAGFAVGLILLPIVFYPILAFGDAQYTRPPMPMQ
jgi:hypothetical protein